MARPLSLVIAAVCLLSPYAAVAGWAQQTGVVVGAVTDSAGVPLSGVLISLRSDERAGASAVTDSTGAYRIPGVAPGTYLARAERAGVIPIERQISLRAGETARVDFLLAPAPVVLDGIIAQARRTMERERERFETDAGITTTVVDRRTLKVMPGLGEADVLRAVQLLPGVVSTSDFSGSYNVRGGSADQNLILIDGFPVFNPFHLGSLFSVFNADAVDHAELFAGGFGAEFGGRVSSVLSIESRSDVPESTDVYAGVSMLAARALVHTPLPDAAAGLLGGEDGGSVLVSARRSYFDQVLRPVLSFPYHLTDLQMHAGIPTRGGGRLSVTGYLGEDVLDFSDFEMDGEDDILRIRREWGNQVIGTRLVQPLTAGWILDSRVGFSRFADRLSFLDFGDVDFHSRIEQLIGRADVSRDVSTRLAVRAGVAADRMEHRNLVQIGGTTFADNAGEGLLGAAYASARWQPTSHWIVEPGMRFDSWRSSDTTHSVISPRFAVKRFFGRERNIALKLAVGRYSQFLHSLRNEEIPVTTDRWVLADRAVPPVISDQVQLGLESFWGSGWSASLEAYARTFDGVTEFNIASDPNKDRDELITGTGSSRGIDFQLRRSEGQLTGWTSVSLLRATRTFPDAAAAGYDDLPQTVTFAPVFDRRVNANVALQYSTSRKYDFGLTWSFGSGLPYTRAVAQYLQFDQDVITGKARPDSDDDDDSLPLGVILGPRNSERYPAYHRLDLTVRRTYTRSWGTFIPYLQVLNVYNRKNVMFYFYNYDKAPPVRSGISMFPILPALGVEVTF